MHNNELDKNKLKTKILNLVTKYYDEYFKIKLDNIDINTSFFKICKNGIDFVDLIIYLENELEIAIDSDDYTENNFNSLSDFINWIVKIYVLEYDINNYESIVQ